MGYYKHPYQRTDETSSWNCASNNRLLKSPIMARGNQRDKAREKAAKADKGKGKAANEQDGNKGLSKEQRQQRDADIMRQKQEKKSSSSSDNCSWKIAKWVKLFDSIKQSIHRLKNIFKSYKYSFHHCSGNFFITQEMHFKIDLLHKYENKC